MYIKNGTLISAAHLPQIAFSLDGTDWLYYAKNKIKAIEGQGTTLRLAFDDNSFMDIDLLKVNNQPTWSTGDATGLTAARNDISAWLLETAPDQTAADLKKYQFGTYGFNIILPSGGTYLGNWYMVKALEDTEFATLKEKNANVVGGAIPLSFLMPEGTILTTSDLDGDGFTTIAITSGKVIAYKKTDQWGQITV
jgi:hypothetical protein